MDYRFAQDDDEIKDGGFKITFPDKSSAECLVLLPPEKVDGHLWKWASSVGEIAPVGHLTHTEYHMAPEIFVSDGPPGSIVGDWVAARAGIGGIHHIAFQVNNVAATMDEWKEKGYAEFCSEEPLTCPGLTQVFTEPSELTGIIYELIKRDKHGFCKANVKNLMESTKGKDIM